MNYSVFIDNEEFKFKNVKKPIILIRKLIRRIVKYNEHIGEDIYKTLINKPTSLLSEDNKTTNFIYTVIRKGFNDKPNSKFYDYGYRITLFK